MPSNQKVTWIYIIYQTPFTILFYVNLAFRHEKNKEITYEKKKRCVSCLFYTR